MSLVTKTIIIILFIGFVIGAISILPDAADHPVPDEVLNGMTVMYQSIVPMDYIIPITLIMTLFLLSLAFEIGYWSWRMVMWIIGIVRQFIA